MSKELKDKVEKMIIDIVDSSYDEDNYTIKMENVEYICSLTDAYDKLEKNEVALIELSVKEKVAEIESSKNTITFISELIKAFIMGGAEAGKLLVSSSIASNILKDEDDGKIVKNSKAWNFIKKF